jgi:DNA-binding MarR family transcriptional regulator
MDICDKLISLRIALTAESDGFSLEQGNKNILLSSRMKILYLLSEKDMTPVELILMLGMAKSNLANLSKLMIADGVLESYKTMENLRNVYYRITPQGMQELHEYKLTLKNVFCNKHKENLDKIESSIDEILELLKKGQK